MQRQYAIEGLLQKSALVALFLVVPGLIVSRGLADVLISFIALLFLAHSACAKDWRWCFTPFWLIVCLAWAWLTLVVTPLAISPEASLQRGLPWIRLPLFFVAVTEWLLVDKRHLHKLGLWLAAIMLFCALDGFIQLFTGISLSGHTIMIDRLTGPFDGPKIGIFTVKMAFPVFALLWCSASGYIGRYATFIFMIVMFTITALSGERTAFLTFVIGSVFMAIFMGMRVRHARLPLLLMILMLQLLCIALYQHVPSIQERATLFVLHVLYFGESPYGYLFSTAWDMGRDHWFSGVGLRGFRVLCPEYLTGTLTVWCNLHPHNPYLEWFAEAGVIGLIILVALIWALALRIHRTKLIPGTNKALLKAAAYAVLIIHFFPFIASQSTFSNWPAVLLWMSLALSAASLNVMRGRP